MLELRTMEYTKLQAAKAQLERAISLYMDGTDYLSAVTLAGAAEELLCNHRDQSSAHSKDRANAVESDHTASMTIMTATIDINSVRDWLNHYQAGDPLSFDAEVEAYARIDRALRHWFQVTANYTELMQSFWAMQRDDALV
jgi:hypothetical protein